MGKAAKMLLWWSAALVAAWILLPMSVESLEAALVDLGALAERPEMAGAVPVDVLKLAGGVAVLMVMWRWATPRYARGRRYRGR